MCSISGFPPQDPVVSPDGIVFDRCAILEHLVSSDSCPVTGSRLSEFMLRDVRNPPAFIEPCTGTLLRNIPAMLNLFRIDFDKRVLENLRMSNEMESIRAEIAQLKTEIAASGELIGQLQAEVAAVRAQKSQIEQALLQKGHISSG